jgi:hypothetical protein
MENTETIQDKETRGINILLKALCSIKNSPDMEIAIKALYDYETLVMCDCDENENDRV